MAECIRHWEATDFSGKMVEEAKKHPAPPNLTFTVRGATALPYLDEAFNAALIANALHIMP
ncbi:class I SAM-dependent methyltransferase [Sporobacter termitidis]|uniref:class I SAM-dependent methyltransferase n=1 Tax=Sporobacter termitidis TaxID=44749 RepID=UPI003BFA7449